jgi:hypothetical protein
MEGKGEERKSSGKREGIKVDCREKMVSVRG